MAEEIVEENMTEETLGENMTEETVEENLTEDAMAEYLETDFRLSEEKETKSFSLTFFFFCCGWFPPGLFRERIPGYIWFFYAAFQVIGIGIWIDIVISSIRYCNSRRMIESNLITLCLLLIPCIGDFGYYCVTKLYIYKDTLIHIVSFL